MAITSIRSVGWNARDAITVWLSAVHISLPPCKVNTIRSTLLVSMLFNDNVSISDYKASNGRTMITKWWTRKKKRGNGCHLIWSILPVSAWANLEKMPQDLGHETWSLDHSCPVPPYNEPQVQPTQSRLSVCIKAFRSQGNRMDSPHNLSICRLSIMHSGIMIQSNCFWLQDGGKKELQKATQWAHTLSSGSS